MSEEINIYEEVTDAQILILFYNTWRKKLLGNILDFEFYKKLQQADPNYKDLARQEAPVGWCVKFHLKEVEKARGVLQVLGMMREAEKNGELEEYYKDIQAFVEAKKESGIINPQPPSIITKADLKPKQ